LVKTTFTYKATRLVDKKHFLASYGLFTTKNIFAIVHYYILENTTEKMYFIKTI
jgi:hypothetical protein